MMHFRNRLLAGSLAVLMAVSSIQYPAGNVRAEESTEKVVEEAIEKTKEIETGTQETDSSRNVEESITSTESVTKSMEIVEATESIETVVSTESTESATESMGIVESTEAAETGTAVEGTESMESTEETGTAETETESEEQEETTGTEEIIEESEEETETEQTLKVSESDIASGSYENVTWVIDANGKLTVEGTGEVKSALVNSPAWNKYNTDIKSAEIKITGITDAFGMFSGCSNLTKVDLSGFDTSKVTDMRCMFYGCSNLTYVDISGFDTSNVTNMELMFNECRKLSKVDLSGFDTGQTTSMNAMFRGCNSLVSIDLSGFDTGRVTNMELMFSGCSSLTSIDISNFDVRNVTKMDYIFNSCSNLKNVKVNVTGVTQYMFEGCNSLESAKINVAGVTNMMNMFLNCKNLINVEISSGNKGNITDMRDVFKGCSSLKNVDFSRLDTGNVINMGGMFAGCSSLESVDLSGFDTSKVTNIKYIFYGCSKLTTLQTPYNLKVSEELSGSWYQADGERISKLPLNLNYSILIMKDQIPVIVNASIKILKNKTVYEWGDILNTDDLTVKYYDVNGIVRTITDYNTNVDEIDMTVSGIKTLIVLYNGFSAEVKITVNEKKESSEKENVKISRISMSDSVYTGKEVSYSGTAVVKEQNGIDITDKVKLIYTYSGVMSDNSVYENSATAPVNAGDYKLTVEVSDDDEKYTGRREYIFSISKAPVEITASDITLDTGASLPEQYEYQVTGLLNGDELITEPTIVCNADTTRAGRYEIVLSGAKVGMNYEIIYLNGILSIESEIHGSYKDIIWDIDINGRLIVEGTGEFSSFSGSSRAPWYQYRENIKSAEIDVKDMKNASCMFKGLNNMTSINLEELDTTSINNMNEMFADCSSLTDLDLSGFHTDNVLYMASIFRGCSSLGNINLSSFTTNRVVDMSSMFQDCNNLNSIDVSSLITDRVTDMNYMFSGCSGLTNIDLTNFDTGNVTNMSAMFWGCSGLTNLDLTSFNTSNVTDMSSMFSFCRGLVSIDLTSFNTGKVVNMASMFNYCNELINIDLTHFNTSRVETMASMFNNCNSLIDLELGNFNTGNVMSMAFMFSLCDSLESIDLSSFNTSNVINMNCMFNGCGRITDLDLSSFDTGNVTDMRAMFNGCGRLSSIDLSSFNTSNVTNMWYMFRYCSNLTCLRLNAFNTSKVTDMCNMFEGCNKLKNLDLSNFDMNKVTDIENLFSGCDELIIIHTPQNLVHSVSLPANVGEVWYQQGGNESLLLPQNLDYSIMMTRAGCIAYGTYKDITWVIDSLGKLIVDGSGEISDSDGENRAPWHKYREYIKSAEVTIKDITDTTYMFYDCHNMESIDLSELDSVEITSVSYMFSGCGSLIKIDLSCFNAEKVMYSIDMFSQCNQLAEICTPINLMSNILLPIESDDTWYQQDGTEHLMLPQNLNYSITIKRNEMPIISNNYIASGKNKGITWSIDQDGKLIAKGRGNFSNSSLYNRAPWYDYRADIKSAEIEIIKIADVSYMFNGCINLTDVDLSIFDTSDITNMKCMFQNCNNLENIDLSKFDTSNVKDMSYMFSICSKLTSLDLSDFDTANVKDMSYMFSGCSNLVNLNLSSFNTSCVKDMTCMFIDCSKLISLDLSSFDTYNTRYMQSMFKNCSKLTNLDLSNFNTVLTSSFFGMFSGCSGLSSLDLSSFKTSSVIFMYDMFADCSELTSLDLSSFDTSFVRYMGSMFRGCSKLTSLDLSNFNTSEVIDFSYMFLDCKSLISLDLSSFDTSNTLKMNKMFGGCSKLESLDINNFDTGKVNNIEEMFIGCSKLTSLDLSKFNLINISKDMNDVFKDCNNLTIIHTPCNLDYTIKLPVDSRNFWYTSYGEVITELPKSLVDSIVIEKKKSSTGSEPYIAAEKVKTEYEAGEILLLDDLIVKYYDREGTVREVTDYTTNVNQIDMSTSGVKQLVITYRGYTTEVPITVKGNETPVKISGLTVSDSIYTSTPFTYTGTPNVITDTGEDVTAGIILTYTYTGTMADGNPYETSLTAPVNAGNYILTVAVDKSDKKYSGSTEYAFKITKAPIELVVSDMTFTAGSPVPETFEYQTKGLLNGDKLIKKPSFICNADMTKTGIYGIVPYGANAGMNYEISYINGTLIVKESEKESVLISGISISDTTYTGKEVAYNGKASVKREDGTDITDNISLTCTYSGKQADGSEYTSTGTAPVNAGSYTLTVAVPQENEDYKGSVEYPFEIARAAVAVTALDKTFLTNGDTKLPAIYPYEVAGLLNGDKLTAEPSFAYIDKDGKEIARDDIDLKKAGQYTVLPRSADAGMNYMINYHKGILTITENLPDDDSSEVLPDDIPETGIPEKNTIWASSIEDQSYTGAAVKPAVRVYFGNKRLTEKTDYTIAYKNNRQPGTAELVITGKGNYTDKKTLHFKILPKDIADKDIIIEDMAYADNGKPHKTAPSVIYNGKKLKAGRDFDITYGEGDYTAAGVYYAVIAGKGNFTGTYDKVKTTIIDKNMLVNKAKIAKIPNQEYRKGQEIILADSMVNVTLNGMTLVKDTDYTVSYVNNQNVGKASVVIKGIGKYAGTKTASFKIVRTPVNLAEASFTCDFNRETVFSKGGCKPVPKVSYDGETLQNGTDYTISYRNNKKCGTALLTVKGKGNYKGSRTFEFTVKPKELSAVAVRTVDTVYVNKANKYQSKPVLTDTDGNVLKAGTDYTVTRYEHDGKTLGKQDCPPENAVITVTIEGKGSYQGTCNAAYQLRTGTSLKNAKITVANQIYTGVSIKPEENAITGASIKKNGTVENLVYGRDYEIAAYGTNIKKGSGTIVLRGLGNYYGEKTVKFKITGKSIE